MRRETEAFLELVRDAEDPTRADEQRVMRALQTSVAAGMTSTVLAHSSVESSWLRHAGLDKTWFGQATAGLGSFGSKLSLLAVCTAAAFGTGDTPRHSPSQLEPSDATRPSPPSSIARPSDVVNDIGPDIVNPTIVNPTIVNPKHGAARAATTTRNATHERRAAGTLRSELSVLSKVQASLKRGDGASALRELDSHETTDLQLLAEREAARILALCLLGRVADARRAATDFHETHAESVQRVAIANSCANSQRNEQR